MARTGTARAGSEPTRVAAINPGEAAGIQRLFAFLGDVGTPLAYPWRTLGIPLENLRAIACQTRIALLNDRPRKALTAFRAHSSVGRAADS
jgi:hypothetical protein